MYSSNRRAWNKEHAAREQLALGSRQLNPEGLIPINSQGGECLCRDNPAEFDPDSHSRMNTLLPGDRRAQPQTRIFVIVHLLFWLLAVAPLWGQNSAPAKAAKPVMVDLKQGASFEIAPHTGMMGGSGVFGLRLAMNYGAVNLEVSGEQVIGETANMYPIAVNFGLNLATRGRLLPYGTVGGGLFLTVPTNALGSETVSTMGINFGGGARFYVTPTFGFRLEARQYVTSVTNELESRDELLIFQEVSLGVTFMFR